MQITLQNADRRQHETGYGRINSYAARLAVDSFGDEAADVQLFISPPYSFLPRYGKLNVGLTMCDHQLDTYDKFDFVGLCNQMDLLLVPSEWDERIFKRDGVTKPIRIVRLGHDHAEWQQPLQRKANQRIFILDRGRDNPASKDIAAKYFKYVDYYRCSGPGKLPRAALKKKYGAADVFLKWSEEGAWSYPAIEAMSAGCLVVTNCPYIFTSASNALGFENAKELNSVLASCIKRSHVERKVEAQLTAAAWSEQLAADSIRETIAEFYATSQLEQIAL